MDAGTFWLVGAGVLLLGLVAAFAYVLVQRRHDWLQQHVHRLDRYLSARAPQSWHFVKHRFSRHTWSGLILTVSIVLFVLLTYFFAAITEGWMDQEGLYRIDQAVHGALAGTLSEGVVTAFRILTHFGDVLTMLLIGVVLAAYFCYRRAWWRLFTLGLIFGVGQAILWTLKWIFARQRPGEQLASAVGHSFPSGHSFTAMVVYGFLIFLTWRWTRRNTLRLPVTAGLVLIILGVGLSRVLLSVHWVSDVIGGLTIGLAWLICSLVITRVVQQYRTTPRHDAAAGTHV